MCAVKDGNKTRWTPTSPAPATSSAAPACATTTSGASAPTGAIIFPNITARPTASPSSTIQIISVIPLRWQARDYGLFGANPFGQHDYENLKDQPHIGDYTIPADGSLTLRYRFYFHYGDEKTAWIAMHYDYAAEK